MRKIKAFLSLGPTTHGKAFDLPGGWDDTSDVDQEEFLDELAEEHMSDFCGRGAYVIEGE